MENQTKEAQNKLMKDKANFQDQLKKIEGTVSQVNRLIERSTGPELVRTKTSVDELFQELDEPQDMPSSFERKTPKTVFLKNQEVSTALEEAKLGRFDESETEVNQCSMEGFQEATAGLETQFDVITRNSEGEQYYCPGDYIAVKIMSTQGEKIAADTRIVDKNDGSYTVSFIPSEAGQQNVSVRINGEKLLEAPLLFIKERSFKPVRFIGGGITDGKKLTFPWGVTVNNSNEIFVSDMSNNRIVVLNENGELIRSFGHNLVNDPTGISIDREGRTFVVSRGNDKICLFNPHGKFVRVVNDDGSLNGSRGISLDSQGNAIVCDTGNKCVRIFSPDGKVYKTVGIGRLQFPYDCLCCENKIFVSDREADVLKVYNSNGGFLYEIGKHGEGKLNSPTGIALDKTGHLLVCSKGNHRVQVYTLDGKFVTKFGEYGEDLGQIYQPTSVSVLKSGRIVVCEFGNNRLQLFA